MPRLFPSAADLNRNVANNCGPMQTYHESLQDMVRLHTKRIAAESKARGILMSLVLGAAAAFLVGVICTFSCPPTPRIVRAPEGLGVNVHSKTAH